MGKSIFSKIANIFGNSSVDKKYEEALSLINYKIALGDIDDALGDLQKLTLKGSLLPEPYLLEAKIYSEHFNHEMKATRLIEYYFDNPRLEHHAGNVELLEFYVGISADFHQQGKAVTFLKHALQDRSYSASDKVKLQACLDSIDTGKESSGIVVKSHPAEASRNLHSLSNRTVMLSAEDLKD